MNKYSVIVFAFLCVTGKVQAGEGNVPIFREYGGALFTQLPLQRVKECRCAYCLLSSLLDVTNSPTSPSATTAPDLDDQDEPQVKRPKLNDKK